MRITRRSGAEPATPGHSNEFCPTVDHDLDGDTTSEGDCNDADAQYNPGVAEIWYDGRDQNCDEWDDNDQDYDAHADIAHGGDDCVDVNATVHPDADESCDGIDNNCNGTIDGTEAVDRTNFYWDDDLDGFGSGEITSYGCTASPGFVSNDDDCDDTDVDVHPDASEVCPDGVDNNCDSWVDVCGALVFSVAETDELLMTRPLDGYFIGNVFYAETDRVLQSWDKMSTGRATTTSICTSTRDPH